MKSNTIEITVSVVLNGETRSRVHVVNADDTLTRTQAFAACTKWAKELRAKLISQGYDDRSITRVDFSAEHSNGAQVLCTSRWVGRTNRLPTDKASYTAPTVKAPVLA